MKKIVRLFLVLVMCLVFCVPAFASLSTVPPVPDDYKDHGYILQKGAGRSYYLLLFPSTASLTVVESPFSADWSDTMTWIKCSSKFSGRYVYDPLEGFYWTDASSGLSDIYSQYLYGSGSSFILANSCDVLDSFSGGIFKYAELIDEYNSGIVDYDSTVPTPLNVRYVKKGETTAELVWDNNDPEDKFDVVIRGVFHWKNNNPIGSWIQDHTPLTGDSSGDITFQLLDSSDEYGVNLCGYSIPPFKYEEIKEKIIKEAGKSAVTFSWYPSEFQVQYVGYDENGKKIYGDAAICRINWTNVKKGEWTSSTMIYSGGVKDDTGVGGDGQSTTHVTDWGEVMGGGGASWDDSTEYDSSGNIVKTEASDNVLSDFINGLVNLPDIMNRFFQTLQTLMSGISELPAFFSMIVSYMPPEFTSLLGMGLVIVILLRIFGR